MAALLWVGDGFALSHRSAGELLELDGITASTVELVGPRGVKPMSSSVVVRRATLQRWETTRTRHGWPVTDGARTMMDLAAVVSEEALEIAFDAAIRKGLLSMDYLLKRLDRIGTQGRRGAGALGRLLRERGDVPAAGSALETKLARLIRHSDLPTPQRQFVISDRSRHIRRVDFAFPHAQLAIEADGATHHFGRAGWESDLRWASDAAACGWRIIHAVWTDCTDDGWPGLHRRIRAALFPTFEL